MAPTKVILLACGSFNPPTNMHLRMFEIARDHLNRLGQHVVVGGVISPVHDAYGKKELESSTHRLEMVKLALKTSDWIRVSDWECNQESWTRTLQVLQYFQNSINAILCDNNNINKRRDGQELPEYGWLPEKLRYSQEPITVKLLCGGDLIESFSVPGLWKESDIETIVGQHGLIVITREGSNPMKFVYESDQLTKLLRHIIIVPEWISNDVSSTKVRRALRRQESVRYLIPDATLDYIQVHQLYGYQRECVKYLQDALSIPLNPYMLTPSPSDVNMLSASPSKADQDITLSLQPIDVPDSVGKQPRVLKNDSEVVYYPGQAVQIHPIDETSGRTKKVGFVDVETQESPKKVITAIKHTAEVQIVAVDKEGDKKNSPKRIKKPPRLSDPTRSRNVFKRSNSDVPTSKSIDDLEAVAVKFEFTREGVKVISDKESIV